MTKWGVAVVAAAWMACAGCAQSRTLADNLLGVWQLEAGAECSLDRVTFRPNEMLQRYGDQAYSGHRGQESSTPVFYRVDGPDRVSAVNRLEYSRTMYVFTDPNHIYQDQMSSCRYERVG